MLLVTFCSLAANRKFMKWTVKRGLRADAFKDVRVLENVIHRRKYHRNCDTQLPKFWYYCKHSVKRNKQISTWFICVAIIGAGDSEKNLFSKCPNQNLANVQFNTTTILMLVLFYVIIRLVISPYLWTWKTATLWLVSHVEKCK